MTQPDLPVIQSAGLTKVFKDFWRRDRVAAVKDLNLEIHRGEVFGLLGPNGSGKSTTIKMLLGLLYPTQGRISVFGKAPTDVAVKARIGYLPEESYLYRFLNARETLDYYARIFRQSGPMRTERIEKLLEMVGLAHEARRRVGEYSKGMARRIGLAQALINDPELLILDEPTSGMDPIGTRQIKNVIRDLAKRGKTVLLSSHLLADVEDVCDRIIILYGGQVRAEGRTRELLSKHDRTQITAPTLSTETLEKIRGLIKTSEGTEVLEVSSPTDTLEAFFLRIVEQAQTANIVTSGARAAGALPEFLADRTAGREQVIESLVSEARKSRPVESQPVEPAPTKPSTEPASRAVIEQLTAQRKKSPAPPTDAEANKASDAEQHQAATQAAASQKDAKPSHAPQPKKPVTADRSVIDSLVRKTDAADKDND